MTEEKIAVAKKLEELTQEKGFIYSLALILLQDFMHEAEEAADIDWQSKLSFQEISFLLGLMVKHNLTFEFIEQDAVKSQVERTYQLFRELHDCYNKPLMEQIHGAVEKGKPSDEDYKRRSDAIFGSGNAMAEAIFYSDSGAYDFQLWELAIKRYQKDAEWLIQNKGFEIETAVAVCKKLKDLTQRKCQSAPKAQDFNEYLKIALSIFCFTQEDLAGFSAEEVKNILQSFSVKPGAVNEKLIFPGDYNVVNSNPIISLESGVYFIPVLFNLAQSIYESPFYWMSQDDKYKEVSFKNRGQATVDIACDYLKGVFGESNVYQQVIIEKVKGHVLTDIDLLAVTGNKAVVLQIKSKKLTIPARFGDEERLKQDFIGAIQDSYDQGKISRDAILKSNGRLIDSNGNAIHLDDSIDDVYVLCVTADFYPAITFQAETFLKKEASDPDPVALSLFDLEILAYYFKDPFEFLYYLRQRISLHGCFSGQSEVDLIAYHLNQKLYPRKDEKSGQPIDWVLVQGMGQLIDAHYPSARGYSPITKAMEKLYTKWANPEFQDIIEQFKRSKQPGFTDAIFFLYDLAGHGADAFMSSVKRMKERCQKEKKSLRLSAGSLDHKSGISYICDYANDGQLPNHVEVYCKVKKYQMKADMWLGLGGLANSSMPLQVAMFSKQPWARDEHLETISKGLYSKPKNMENGKKIGRNDRCFCGSEVKYKKCHGLNK